MSVLILLSVVFGLLLFFSRRVGRLQDPQASESQVQRELTRQKSQEVHQAVEALMELPDEEPTIATVHDLSQLQGQAFFSSAEEGDMVLIFVAAKKTVLYRPSSNKIINVAALEVQE